MVWSRLFVYPMGSSHLSIALVVSVFMGGLALGSFLGGRLSDRSPSPLRLYGWLVLLAGISSGAVVPLLWAAEPVLGLAYRLHDGTPNHPVFTLVKALVCAGTILLPTTLMGATLPALARHLTGNLKEVGARLGTLYAVNTFGAVAGAGAAGFFLIRRFGLGWSAAVGAGLDVLVGAAVLLAARGVARNRTAVPIESHSARSLESPQEKKLGGANRPMPEGVGELSREPEPASRGLLWPVRIAVLAFGVSGLVNMALQLGWTKALIISIGNSTYAFTVIVSVFIFGLAAGGWIAGLFADRLRNPLAAFGWLLVLTAIAAGATIPWLGLSPARFALALGEITRSGNMDYIEFLWAGAGSVVIVILPATILMGMGFPVVGRLRTLVEPAVGKAVGAAYASNTAGAIVGTALAGFVLMPLLGRIWKLLYLSVGLGLLAGVAVLVAVPGPRRALRSSLAGAVVIAVLAAAYFTRPYDVLPSPGETRMGWHPVIFAKGSFYGITTAQRFNSVDSYVEALTQFWEPLYYRDGDTASVAVLRNRKYNHTCLNISGKIDASVGDVFSFDHQTQLLLGHLPLLVHPKPSKVLNLGLGGGMTVGAMSIYPQVESIDLLELSPEVVEAARLCFAEANKAALTNPKVRTIIGDGRNHLTHTARMYDVISSEPSNFWIAGLGNLFTEDFYRILLDHLNPGGLVCQWIYGYNIRLHDYHTALRTILRVFPHVTVWTSSYGDTLLLCAKDPIVFDRAGIAAAMVDPAVRADLASLGIAEPGDLFRYFQAEGEALQGWVGEGPTNRDLFPVLEFSSPLGFFDEDPGVVMEISRVAPEKLPPRLFNRFSLEEVEAATGKRKLGHALIRFFRSFNVDKKFDQALAEYQVIAQAGDGWAMDCTSRAFADRSREMGAQREAILKRAREIHDTAELCMADDFRIGPQGGAGQVEFLQRVAQSAPKTRWEPYLALAQVQARAALLADALKSLDVAEERRAPPFKVLHLRGVAFGMQGDRASAEKNLREAIERTPPLLTNEKGEAVYNLGFCLEGGGRLEEAATCYRQAMELGNDGVRAGIALARCLRKGGAPDAAIQAATQALAVARESGRESGEARAEISRAHAAAGRLAEAERWMETAVQISPGLYQKELEELRKQVQR